MDMETSVYTNSAISWKWIADVTDDIAVSVVLRPHTSHVYRSLHSTNIALDLVILLFRLCIQYR